MCANREVNVLLLYKSLIIVFFFLRFRLFVRLQIRKSGTRIFQTESIFARRLRNFEAWPENKIIQQKEIGRHPWAIH